MTKILAVHAHPDDVETLSAGTLALLARAGCEIVIATLTAGECGTLGDAEETARVRREEAAAAAALVDAQYLCAGLPDLGVFNDDRCRRATTELLREARPDVVIGPSPEDYHPDHEAAGVLVRDACFAASAPAYRTGDAAPLETIPSLYFCDAIGARLRDGAPAPADFGVDIGDVMDLKRAMLRRHVSQVEWLAKQHAMSDFTAGMQAQAARRGRDFGVAFAEAFRHYRHLPYPRRPVLQEMLGPAVLQAQVPRRDGDAAQQS